MHLPQVLGNLPEQLIIAVDIMLQRPGVLKRAPPSGLTGLDADYLRRYTVAPKATMMHCHYVNT